MRRADYRPQMLQGVPQIDGDKKILRIGFELTPLTRDGEVDRRKVPAAELEAVYAQAEAAMPLCIVTASGRPATTAASVDWMRLSPGGSPSP